MERKATTVVRCRLDLRDLEAAFRYLSEKGIIVRSIAGLASIIVEAYCDGLYKSNLSKPVESTEEAMDLLIRSGIILQKGNEKTRQKEILKEAILPEHLYSESLSRSEDFLEGGDK